MVKLIIIGGSAGSFRPVCEIIENLRPDLGFPVVLVLHRLKNINEGFQEILNTHDRYKRVIEPCDKEKIVKNAIYLAPANYHLLFKDQGSFCLSCDEPYMYSRPSIDLAFVSAAMQFKTEITGIILSGANKDGANGLLQISKYGGNTLIQDPKESEVKTMPQEAHKRVKKNCFMNTTEIWKYINSIA